MPILPDLNAGKAANQSRRIVSRRAFALVLAGAFLLVSAIAYGLLAPIPVERLLPKTTMAVIGADAAWWWNATSATRTGDDAQKDLKEFETKSGLSIDNDILPWLGDIVVSTSHIDPTGNGSSALVCGQVKDPISFGRCFALARTKSTGSMTESWSQRVYDGIPIFVTAMPQKSSPDIPVKVALVHDWVVVGFGASALEQSLDTYVGKKPSVTSVPKWSDTESKMPSHPVLWGAIDSGGFLKLAATAGPSSGITAKQADLYRSISMFSMSETPKGLRMDGVGQMTSDAGRTLMQKIKGPETPVHGYIMARMPDDTGIALVLKDPAGWLRRMLPAIAAISDPTSRQTMTGMLASIKPVEDVMNPLTGECGVALSWRDGDGLGVNLLAQTASNASASRVVNKLRTIAANAGTPLYPSHGAYVITVPQPPKDPTQPEAFPFKLEPCMKADGAWLEMASHPLWLNAPAGRADLKMPPASSPSDFIEFGNFRWINSIATVIDKQWTANHVADKTPAPVSPGDAIRAIGLDGATWTAYGAIGANGQSQSTFVIDNWDWRQAITNIADLVRKDQAAKKLKGAQTGA